MQKNKRSMLQNVGFIFEGVADALGHTTGMVAKFASAGEELGEATLVLSKSNTKVITIKSRAEEALALKELQEEFGDDIFEIVE